MAQLTGYFLQYKNKPDEAVANVTPWLQSLQNPLFENKNQKHISNDIIIG